MQSNQSPKKKAIFLRSNSSDALVEATNEIRRKHSRLLRTEKRETKKEARSFYALFINHDEETESNSAKSSPTKEPSNPETSSNVSSSSVMLRRRRSDFAKKRNRVVSMPSKAYRSLLSLDGSYEVAEDTISVRSLRMRTDRISMTSVNLDELGEILKHNVQSRREDEAKAAEEKERHMKIMEMYQKYPVNAEERNTSLTSGNNYLSMFLPTSPSNATATPGGFSLRRESDGQENENNVVPESNYIQEQDEASLGKETNVKSNAEFLKQTINDLETQISQRNNQFEIERALLDVKITAEKRCLGEEEIKCEKIKVQVIELEENFFMKREKYNDEIQDNNTKLHEIQEKISETQSQIDKSPESLREYGEENLYKQLETYNEEVKALEDAEFDIMETLSNLDEEKEKQQKSLIFEKKKLDYKISNRKNRLKMLENQLAALEHEEKLERNKLFEDRDAAIELLQEQQNANNLESNASQSNLTLTSSYPTSSSAVIRHSQSFASKNRRLLSLESFLDSISNVDQSDTAAKKAPVLKTSQSFGAQTPSDIVHLRNPRKSLNFMDKNRKHTNTKETSNEKIIALRDLNDKDGDQHRIRRRVSKDRFSISSAESADASLFTSVKDERLKLMQQRLAEAQAKKEILLHDISVARNSYCGTPVSPSLESVLTSPANSETNISPAKEEAKVKLRFANKPNRQTRPMSRYLPNRSSDFNLQDHLEGCGHNPAACRHVVVTATSCSGYLSKKGGRIRTWKKKWFVFDRIQKKLICFSDKREIKEKGSVSFELIQDVFFDHIKSHKSPNPSLTFCMKCADRCYYFSAPSAEAMRIWMDVLVTGAEGYREYMKTVDQQ